MNEERAIELKAIIEASQNIPKPEQTTYLLYTIALLSIECIRAIDNLNETLGNIYEEMPRCKEDQ